jgi:ABC-type transport system substrate-binding protein
MLVATTSGAAAAALLAACGSDDNGGSGSGGDTGGAKTTPTAIAKGSFTPSDGTPVQGGHMIFHVAQNANLNPLTDWAEGNVISGVFAYDRPLSSREDDRRYVLEAMESIEQPEPTKVVMKLRAGQTFHDIAPVSGRAVSSNDIKATQEYIASIPNAYDKTFVSKYLDRMETPDDKTMIYYLKQPMAYLYGAGFLGNGTGQVILPAETLNANLTGARQIGSGPYIHESSTPGQGGLYKKNPKFRDAAKVYVAEREYKVIGDPVALESAFRTGQVDWIYNGSANLTQTLKRDLPGTTYELPGMTDNVFRWNMQKETAPWKKDVRVREAIWRLTNRQQVLELAYKNAGVMSYGLVPAAYKNYLPDQKLVEPYWQEDVAKAKQLLSAANFPMDKELLFIVSGANQDPMAVYQQQLDRAGVKARLQPYSGIGQFFQMLAAGEWDTFHDATPGSGDPYISIRNQHSDSWSSVYRGFALYDKDIDAMIEKSESTLDLQENIKLVKEIQLECMKRFTVSMILFTLNRNFLVQKRVQNLDLALTQPNPQHQVWLKGA